MTVTTNLPSSLAFASAISAAARERCVIDVSSLDFTDVAGMRTIAETARSAQVSVQLHGVRDTLRRNWRIAGFHEWHPPSSSLLNRPTARGTENDPINLGDPTDTICV